MTDTAVDILRRAVRYLRRRGRSPETEEGGVDIYERRRLKSSAHLHGRGIEIGAGARPHALPDMCEALYFDVRTHSGLAETFGESISYHVRSVQEIPRCFPDGADFLIAHHVLEHTPDPIGTLRAWHRYVRPDGTMVVSVPNYVLCPDRDRLLPDMEHLLLDHVLGRDGDSFESREHVLSFLCSWVNDSPGLAPLSKSECCRRIVSETKRGGHDLHWHAFDREVFYATVTVSALLDGMIPVFLEEWSGDEGGLDILAIYRLAPSSGADDPRIYALRKQMESVQCRLQSAADQLNRISLRKR